MGPGLRDVEAHVNHHAIWIELIVPEMGPRGTRAPWQEPCTGPEPPIHPSLSAQVGLELLPRLLDRGQELFPIPYAPAWIRRGYLFCATARPRNAR